MLRLPLSLSPPAEGLMDGTGRRRLSGARPTAQDPGLRQAGQVNTSLDLTRSGPWICSSTHAEHLAAGSRPQQCSHNGRGLFDRSGPRVSQTDPSGVFGCHKSCLSHYLRWPASDCGKIS